MVIALPFLVLSINFLKHLLCKNKKTNVHKDANKKSRIQETLNLSASADSSANVKICNILYLNGQNTNTTAVTFEPIMRF